MAKKKWEVPMILEIIDRRTYMTAIPLKGIHPFENTKICRPRIKHHLEDIVKRRLEEDENR